MITKRTFPGGVHPAHSKNLTRDKEICTLPLPKKVVIPLAQSIGKPAKSLVKAGDIVLKGQVIGQADGFISSMVHSSVSGKVVSVAPYINPVYGKAESVTVESDGVDNLAEGVSATRGIESLSREQLIDIIKNAGIVGLGGAAFPTHVKLIATEKHKPDSLIINGVECEPYLTCDYRLMMEKAKEIIDGIEILDKVISSASIYIAIEDNKEDAIRIISEALDKSGKEKLKAKTRVVSLKAKYPQGGEKQIIKAILNREVPPGKLPLEVGCMVQNVGTAFAIREAVYKGNPLIERCVTLTGACLKNPCNIMVRVGTLLSDIVNQFCGGFTKEPGKIILGGPMMGIAQHTLDFPIMKGVSGIVFLPREEVTLPEESPCIRCAKCVDVCPVNLMPTYIARTAKKHKVSDLKELNPLDCIECGACAFECPARIPLVQYLKLAKACVRNLCD